MGIQPCAHAVSRSESMRRCHLLSHVTQCTAHAPAIAGTFIQYYVTVNDSVYFSQQVSQMSQPRRFNYVPSDIHGPDTHPCRLLSKMLLILQEYFQKYSIFIPFEPKLNIKIIYEVMHKYII